MNKELEEAIKICNNFKNCMVEKDKLEIYKASFKLGTYYKRDLDNAIEIVLKALENSISKEVIKEKKNKLLQEYREIIQTNSIKAFIIKCQIELLQELLEVE